MRVQRRAGLTVRGKALPHHHGGLAPGLFDVADPDAVPVEDVAFAEFVTDALLDERAVRADRLLGVDDDWQLLQLVAHVLEGVESLVLGVSDDRGELLALVHHLVDGEGEVVAHQEVLHHVAPRFDLADDVGAGEHGMHARLPERRRRVDGEQPGVRHRAAQDLGVEHAGQLDVVDEARGTGEQRQVLAARDGLPDELGLALGCGPRVRSLGCLGHLAPWRVVTGEVTRSGTRSRRVTCAARPRCRGS